jgi:PAS domain S-box-containing protein
MSEHHPLEARYDVARAAAGVGIWTWSRGTDSILWDEIARDVLGLTDERGEGLGALAELVHPGDRPLVEAALAATTSASAGGSFEQSCRIVRPGGGQERWVILSGRLEADADGPLRICGAVRDVTDLKLAEERSSRLEAGLWAIVTIAADAIVSLDQSQRITLFNDGAEQIFGYRREEVIGEQLEILMPERFRSMHARHVEGFGQAANASRRMNDRGEIYALRKSGEEFPAEASISHVELGGERIYTVVLRDISERKRTLDMLASSRDELERRVAERTAELKAEMQRREATQAQLVRTQRMEAFGQLTGGIAHDFNNLLTVISGNLELLEMRLEDERSLAVLKRAQDAAAMGARLTSRLLTFARRRQFAPAVLDLNEQVMGMVDLLKRTLGDDIDLNARLSPRLWRVRADASEVENAVLNLAINSRDAMPGGGRLVIETANIEVASGEVGAIGKLPAGNYVRLSVSDTGTGMPPEILARAFEPFFTTKETGRGTGLGLATIIGFAQQSGGTAKLYSEPGAGTTVSIYLPRADGGEVSAGAGEQAILPAGAGELVLLVEDNAEVREVARNRLEALGYRVTDAGSGPAALAVFDATPDIALVFTDLVMPGGMSGLDVARAVRLRRPGTPVLLTSGFADDALREADGVDLPPLLHKPYGRAELARAVRQALDA